MAAGNWFDAIIAWFSPAAGMRRQAARRALELSSGYRSANRGRLNRNRGVIGSPDYHLELDDDRRELVLRAQLLQRNNCFAEGLLTRATDNVVGRGIRPQATSSSKPWNDRAEGLFNEWANSLECDLRGMADFWELQRLIYRSYLSDGDVGVIKHGKSRAVQVVTSSLIASPFGKEREANFRDGVELDANGRPVAYHIVQNPDWRHSAPRDQDKRVRVSREDMLFLARRNSATQTRGLPVFAQTMKLFDQIDGLIEAVIVAARMAACFGLVVETPFGPDNSALSTQTGADGELYQLENFEPGAVKYLEIGEKISQIKPDHPGTNFSDFMVNLVRLLGLQLAMPLELVLLDHSRVNYSSMRGGLLQYYRHARGEQQKFAHHILRPIWQWKVAEFIAQGKLTPRRDALAHEWVPEGWAYMDPIKEAQGHLLELDMGTKTLSEIAKGMGKDFATLLEARKREMEDMREAGLPEVRSTFTRDPQPEPAPNDEEDVTKEEMQAEFRVLRAELRADRAETLAPRIAEPAVPNITANIHVPESLALHQPAPVVNVQASDLPAPIVNVNVPEQAPPTVNLAPLEQPTVVVEAPVIHNHVDVPSVDVHVPEPKPRTLKVHRDQSGNMTGAEVE